jgi:hypothetical protein
MRRLRVTGLALLALAVPPFALGGEEPPSGPADLSVSASLAGCGLVDAAIVCQIDAGWTPLEGADYYTVSVTRPDGSVVDAGEAAGAGRSLFVPYVGPGTYAVEVAAWGTPPGEDDPEVLVREKTLSTSAAVGQGDVTQEPGKPGEAEEAGDGRDAAEPGAITDQPGSGPNSGVIAPPACEEPEDEAPGEEPGAEEERSEAAAEAASEPDLTPAEEDDDRPDDLPVCP